MDINLELQIPTNRINLLSFNNEYERYISPFIQTGNNQAYNWYLFNRLTRINKLETVQEFFHISKGYFSKDLDCFINQNILENIQSISLEDKKKFEDYMKFRFHFGYNFALNFSSDFLDITYNNFSTLEMMSFLVNKELTSEETLDFLNIHNIKIHTYELISTFCSEKELADYFYKIIKENKEVFFKEIAFLLKKYQKEIFDFLRETILNFFEKQFVLLSNFKSETLTSTQGA